MASARRSFLGIDVLVTRRRGFQRSQRIGCALAVEIENRIGLVNEIAVLIHHAVRSRPILQTAFILNERDGVMVNGA